MKETNINDRRDTAPHEKAESFISTLYTAIEHWAGGTQEGRQSALQALQDHSKTLRQWIDRNAEQTAGLETHMNVLKQQMRAADFPMVDDSILLKRVGTLPMHNGFHTRLVVQRTLDVLNTMRDAGVETTDEKRLAARIAASAHDVVQLWRISKQGAFVVRARAMGENEKMSAQIAQSIWQTIGLNTDHLITHAIIGTIPKWDAYARTIVSTGFDSQSISPLARALWLADLGDAGLDTKAFLETGDKEFREIHVGLACTDISKITPQQKEQLLTLMLGWSALQEQFAKGRRERFETETAGLPEAAKQALRRMFVGFDVPKGQNASNTQLAAGKRTQARNDMTFEQLYNDFGFQQEES